MTGPALRPSEAPHPVTKRNRYDILIFMSDEQTNAKIENEVCLRQNRLAAQFGNFNFDHKLVLEGDRLMLLSLVDNQKVFDAPVDEIAYFKAFSPIIQTRVGSNKYTLSLAENPKRHNVGFLRGTRSGYMSGMSAMYKPVVDKWVTNLMTKGVNAKEIFPAGLIGVGLVIIFAPVFLLVALLLILQ